MLEVLRSIYEAAVFFVDHIIELVLFIPHMLTMFADSYGLIYASIGSAPAFLLPLLILILAVAVIMWLVNLL